jgi:hypothetical protein
VLQQTGGELTLGVLPTLLALGRRLGMYGVDEGEQQIVDMHLAMAREVASAYRARVLTPVTDFPELQPLPLSSDAAYVEKLTERQTAVTMHAERTEKATAVRAEGLSAAIDAHVQNVFEPWLRAIEATLKSGGPYLLGGKASVADMFAFHLLSLHLGLRADVLAKYPAAFSFFLEVGSSERVGAYMASTKRLAHANPITALWGNKARPELPAANPFRDAATISDVVEASS